MHDDHKIFPGEPAPAFKVRSDPVLRSVLLSVTTAQFLTPFMMAGITPLLPAIGRDLNGGAVELGLVSGVYGLSLATFHLISARLGDMVGRRKLFMIGLVFFLIITTILPFSPNMPIFLALRFVQAAGVAMMGTSSLSILVACAPPSARGRVIGLSTVGTFAGISCGPFLGGLIGTYLDWRWMFFLVLPFGVMSLILMARKVKQDWTDNPEAPFDWRGAICYAFGISALSFGTTWLIDGWWAAGLLVVGLIFLYIFVRGECKSPMPILDVRFIASHPIFAGNVLTSLISYSTVMGVTFYFSFYLQFMLGLDMRGAGVILTAQPALQLICSPIAGRLADRFGPLHVSICGLILCGIALGLGTAMPDRADTWYVICLLGMVGMGLGLFAAPNTAAIMASVDRAHLGQASGLVGTVRTLGMLVSMVLVTLTMNAFLGSDPVHSGNLNEFMLAMRTDLMIFNVLNLVAILLTLWLLYHSRKANNLSI